MDACYVLSLPGCSQVPLNNFSGRSEPFKGLSTHEFNDQLSIGGSESTASFPDLGFHILPTSYPSIWRPLERSGSKPYNSRNQ